MHTLKGSICFNRPTRDWLAILSAVFLFMMTPLTAHALTLELGMSSAKASRAMVNQGFSQIQIVEKGFKTMEAVACQNGTRFKVKIDSRYRIKKTQNMGPCRRTVSVERLRQNLERSGFTRVIIENQNAKYVAIACRNEARVRITYSRQGEVLQRRNIGTCRDVLEPNDIRPILHKKGYNRIRFTDRQLPTYIAEACRNDRRFELTLDRFGEIRRENRIGRCDPPIDPRKLASLLENKGYDRIEIISDKPPFYEAQACAGNDRVALQLNRYGTITSREIISKCRRGMTGAELVGLLEDEGFKRVSIERNNRGQFLVEACLDGYKKFATISQFGELLSERDGQRCEPRSIADITDSMRSRGFRDIEFYAEGCRKGRTIRLGFDKNGERVSRERLGAC